MQTAALDMTLSSSVLTYKSCWCRLEQIIPDEKKKSANIADVYNLWLTAATGRSAIKLRPDGCPVEFDGATSTIRAFLGFFVWPSQPNLSFLLSSTFGRFSSPSPVSVLRSFSVMVDHSRRYALPYHMVAVNAVWETPVFNSRNELISHRPKITVEDGLWLVFPEDCFGALRVTGLAQGFSTILELEFIKTATERPLSEQEQQEWHAGPSGEIILSPSPSSLYESYKITDLQPVIKVSYSCGEKSYEDEAEQDELENTDITIDTETLNVTLPKCLEDVLSFCPGDADVANIFCEQIPTTTVYYNACEGTTLGETTKRDGNSYCSKVVDSPTAGIGWLPNEAEQ